MGRAAGSAGTALAVIGAIAMVGGLGAAALGLYDQQQARADFVPDPERRERNDAFVLWGGTVAAAGLVLFLAGLVALSVGRGPASATTGASDPGGPAAPDNARRNAVAAGAVGLLLVGLLVAFVFYVQSDGGPIFGGGKEEPRVVYDRTFNGTVRGASFGGAGLDPVLADDRNVVDVTVPKDAVACQVTLTWEEAAGTGAEALRLEVLRSGTQVASGEGESGVAVTLEGEGLAGASHRIQVLPAGAGAVSQPFQVRVACIAPA